LVTDAAYRVRVLYSSACTAHPACYLNIGIVAIQAQSPHPFTELFDYDTCCKTPEKQVLDDDLGQGNYRASENGLFVTLSFAAG